MGKVIRLTESDLIKLVKRVIKEQENVPGLKQFNEALVALDGADSKTVQYILKQLPNTVKFIAIINCESADFSDIDLCSFPELVTIRISNTPNNFLENVNCEVRNLGEDVYEFERDSE